MKRLISVLLVMTIILSCLVLASCDAIHVEKYVKEDKIDLKDLLTDSHVDTISAYLGNYTHIAEINTKENINQICNMFLNDIEVETEESKILEFKSTMERAYGSSFLSLCFNELNENKIVVRIYYDNHIYISAYGKEFVSYSSCSNDLDQIYIDVLANRTSPKQDTTDLNIQFSLINEAVGSISMCSSSGDFIDYADIDKVATLQGILMLYVSKYDFTDSSEALFYAYEYLKCEEQIYNSTIFIVQYQDGSESRFYLGTDNRIYYIDECGNMFVSEKEYIMDGHIV